jgi:hypothetical protein
MKFIRKTNMGTCIFEDLNGREIYISSFLVTEPGGGFINNHQYYVSAIKIIHNPPHDMSLVWTHYEGNSWDAIFADGDGVLVGNLINKYFYVAKMRFTECKVN